MWNQLGAPGALDRWRDEMTTKLERFIADSRPHPVHLTVDELEVACRHLGFDLLKEGLSARVPKVEVKKGGRAVVLQLREEKIFIDFDDPELKGGEDHLVYIPRFWGVIETRCGGDRLSKALLDYVSFSRRVVLPERAVVLPEAPWHHVYSEWPAERSDPMFPSEAQEALDVFYAKAQKIIDGEER